MNTVSQFDTCILYGMHPALRGAIGRLAEVEPEAVKRAASALNLLLRDLCIASDYKAAWSFSRLTPGGFPVEFSFSDQDLALRYTTEAAGSDTPPTELLACALSRLDVLNAPLLPPVWQERLPRIQREGDLQYGAWVGGRHTGETDRYKLYAEVPRHGSAEGQSVFRSYFGRDALYTESPGSLRMIGLDLAGGGVEFYLRFSRLSEWDLRHLLYRSGVAPRAEEFLALLCELTGSALTYGVPGGRFGVSFAIDGQGAPQAFSLFLPPALFGPSDALRASVLARYAAHSAPALPGSLPCYAHLTSKPFSPGLVALIAPVAGPLAIGLAVFEQAKRP